MRLEGTSSAGRGLLKEKIAGTTVNVHMHLGDSGWWKGGQRIERPAMSQEQVKSAILDSLKTRYGLTPPPEEQAGYVRRILRSQGAFTLEEHAQLFLEDMDKAGLDLTVIMAIDQSFMPGDLGRQFAIPYEQVMEEMSALQKSYPERFRWFAGVNPHRARGGVKLFERAVKEFGCAGLGEWVTQQWHVFPYDHDLCYPYYEKCLELGVPFLNNCEGNFSYCSPISLEPVAKDFPKLKIGLGGAGRPRTQEQRAGRAQMTWPDEALRLAEEYENVYIDLDDWQRRDEEGIRWYLTYLKRTLSGPARHRVMFGSDHPVLAFMYTEKEWIEVHFSVAAKYGVEFSKEELELYFSKNALEYLSTK